MKRGKIQVIKATALRPPLLTMSWLSHFSLRAVAPYWLSASTSIQIQS
ncbi:MAG: hypothetical protein HQK70_14590 [Desulfamplus sp.]|nr:hypothetical protein [Desulfamplus sp.]